MERNRNIVLIGLSGCGKSSAAKRLAKRLGMPLLDTDAMVEARAKMTVSELFAARGEAYFRDLESACVREAAGLRGVVIATGGGVVLREENMLALRQGGVVFFLDRHPSRILHGANLSNRPLVAGDVSKLLELYRQRLPLYRKFADARVENAGRLKRAVLAIIRKYRQLAGNV